MLKRYLLLILPIMILTGCATTTDPRQGGFFGGLYGMSSGAYDKRIQTRQNYLNHQKDLNEELNEEAQTLEHEFKVSKKTLAKELQRVQKMGENLSRMESEINLMNAKSDKKKNELVTLKRDIKDQRKKLVKLQSDLAALNNSGGDIENVRYQALKRERDRLAEEHRRLLEYSNALSRATD